MKEIDQEISNKIDGLFSFDDDKYDQVNVVDKGLGFHHKKESLKESGVNVKNLSHKKTNIPLPVVNEIKEVAMPKTLSHRAEGMLDNQLSNIISSDSEKNNSSDELDDFQLSSVEKVAMSWAVDFLIILSVLGGTIYFIFNVSGVNFGNPVHLLKRTDFAIFFSSFFVLFYLLYFTVLEMLGSPGRMFFGTRLTSTEEGEPLRSWQTFSRALIILASPFLLLIPLYFGWHDSLSRTSSVEDKW